MSQRKMINLAIDCVKREMRRLAVDANLYEKYGAKSPHAQRCSERRKELREVVDFLKRLLEI
ncbi:MAG: hypothetical protein ABIG63_16500 [Chloroflexota bacterium]